MALKHAKTSGKTDGGDAALVQPSDWNANHIIDSDGATMATRADEPTAPSAGGLILFGKTFAGGALPAYVGPSGLSSALQPFIGRNKIGVWAPSGNTTTTNGSYYGIAVWNSLGTATARTVEATNLFTSMRRIGYVSNATAGNRAIIYGSAPQFWRGNAAGLGGFRTIFRFGCSDAATVADARSFVGLSPSSTVGNASPGPSASLNIIGIGSDGGDANFSVFHNDGSGTATKIPLGANFPANTLSADVYELALFAAPNASDVGWQVTRLNTGHVASGTISTDLPVNDLMLMPAFMRHNGSTALAVGIDMMGLYAETDY